MIDMTGYSTEQYAVERIATKEEVLKSGLKPKGRYWLCRCKCGNTFLAMATWLRRGLKQSCGCLRSERISKSSSEDLSGQKFGMLTALYLNGQDNARHNIWHCICDCGQETDVLATNLKKGHTKSCGCEKSFGEKRICDILSSLNIKAKRQYSFDDLKGIGGGLLLFDFAFVDDEDNLIALLEYQGVQHYKYTPETAYFGYQQREHTDKAKRRYCMKHNIQLFEIKYNENIDVALYKILDMLDLYHANPVPNAS